jgi:hypothetical protein
MSHSQLMASLSLVWRRRVSMFHSNGRMLCLCCPGGFSLDAQLHDCWLSFNSLPYSCKNSREAETRGSVATFTSGSTLCNSCLCTIRSKARGRSRLS